jgi:flagellin-like protein
MDYKLPQYPPATQRKVDNVRKMSWLNRNESEAVSPVIATILLVGITVVLAATLYVMIFGFGADTNNPPVATFTKDSVQDGFKFTFTPFSRDTTWDQIAIVLTDDSNAISFNNTTTTSMSSQSGTMMTVKHCDGSRALGTLTIWMNATDLAGNGYVNQGDSVTLTSAGGQFSKSTTYTIVLLYKPTGDTITSQDFTGD